MKIPRIAFQDLEAKLFGKDFTGNTSEDFVEVAPELPDGCFVLDMDDAGLSSQLDESGVAVFSRRIGEALDGIYLFRKSAGCWLLCRLLRTESPDGESPRYRPSRRKSFMTPTPLHIPGSRVSPIPDYTHAVFILEPFSEKRVEVVPADRRDSLFPLVHLERSSG